jgi:Holliday junction resolvasome RuvABC endonuclease subunit
MTAPKLIAIDPSLRATGWAILDIMSGELDDCGVVVTTAWSDTRKRSVPLFAEQQSRDGAVIFGSIREKARGCSLGVIEAHQGSSSAKSAMCTARANQAAYLALTCADIVPAYVSPFEVKRWATGSTKASKDEMKAAACAAHPGAPFNAMLGDLKRSVHDGAYDAVCIGSYGLTLPNAKRCRAFIGKMKAAL